MTTGVSLSAVVTSSAEKRGKSTCSVSSMPGGGSVQFGLMLRLFRIIDSSDPERKLDGAGTHFSLCGWRFLPGRVLRPFGGLRGSSRANISDLLSSSSPGRYNFALVSRRRRLSLAACVRRSSPRADWNAVARPCWTARSRRSASRATALSYSLRCRFWMCAAI